MLSAREGLELEGEIALELMAQLFHEIAAGVEPCHLVFVLVGHELEELPRHRLGEAGAAGCLLRFFPRDP